MSSEERNLIEAQNKRIALLEDEVESVHRELATIRGVISDILKTTRMIPVVAVGNVG